MVTNMKELEELLKDSQGKKVRYRLNGMRDFQNDILVGYGIQGNDIIILLEKCGEIETPNVNEISFTEYEERTDIWLHSTGSIVNRFNLYV